MQVATEQPAKKSAKSLNIPEHELAQFALDRENFRIEKKKMEAMEKSLKAREMDFIERLDNGGRALTKSFLVAIDRSETRRNVKWKDVAVAIWNSFGRNGQAEADKVMEKTEPDVYPRLVISLAPKQG